MRMRRYKKKLIKILKQGLELTVQASWDRYWGGRGRRILGRLQAGRITFAFTWISHSLFIHRPSSLWSADSESAVNNSNYCIIAVASIVLRALWSPQSLRSLTRPIIKVMNVKRRNYLFLSNTCPSYTVSQTLEILWALLAQLLTVGKDQRLQPCLQTLDCGLMTIRSNHKSWLMTPKKSQKHQAW